MNRGPQSVDAIHRHIAYLQVEQCFTRLLTERISGQRRAYLQRVRRPYPEHVRRHRDSTRRTYE